MTRVEREYHRLFLGPVRPVAPPFESVYREGALYGLTTSRLLRDLREAGLEPVESFRLPPDHVAVQLEFLAYLEARAREERQRAAFDEADRWSERARSLVEEHLAVWLPLFLLRLETGAPESPYTALVRTALGILGVSAARAEGT